MYVCMYFFVSLKTHIRIYNNKKCSNCYGGCDFRATEHQQRNMMSSENLAIVFAPTLLRSPETDPLTSLTASKYERELIEMLISNQTSLFEG